MKKVNYIIAATLFTLLTSACQTVVDIELPERDSKLVLNSLFSPDSNFVFTLSQSKGILEPGELDHLNNGRIEVYGSDGTHGEVTGTGQGSQTFAYRYKLPFKPKANIAYTVKASAPGLASVTASDVLPLPVAIDDLDTSSLHLFDTEEKQIGITFTDPAHTSNFYEVKLFYMVYIPQYDTNGQVVGMTASVTELPSYISNEGLFSNGVDERVFTDDLFNGRSFTVTLGFQEENYLPIIGDSNALPDYPIYLIAELRSASEDYYKFNSSFLKYQNSSGDPFAQPVQVYNNVEGGFGIVAGYSSARDTMRVN